MRLVLIKSVSKKDKPIRPIISVIWSPKESRDWEGFHSRLQYMARRYDALGYNYAKYSIISPD